MELILLTSLIIFCASFVRSAIGFGDALLAMPAITMISGLELASPLVAMTGTTMAILILFTNLKNVRFRVLIPLILATLPGIPLGLLLLKAGNHNILQIILGLVIFTFSIMNLAGHLQLSLRSERWSAGFGFLAGMMGGAFNTNGPPIVIYALLRNWDSASFRITMQGYFLVTGGVILAGHFISGNVTEAVIQSYAYSIIALIAGLIAGGILHNKLNRDTFRKWVFILLSCLGTGLIIDGVVSFL